MATAIQIASALLSLMRTQKVGAATANLLGYKGDGPAGEKQAQVPGSPADNAFDGGFYVDELWFNRTGGALSAGDWVAQDVTQLTTDDLVLAPLGISNLPDAALIRRMKQAVAASPEPVIGVLMEATANLSWGRVRRFGWVTSSIHGVTPNMDGTLAQGSVRALTIHASTAGKAAHQLATLRGTATVLDTESSVVVSVGTGYNGLPALACMSEADGTVHVLHAIVAAGDLTITLSDVVTGDRTVSYVVFGSSYDRTIGYQVAHDANLKLALVTCL